MDVKKIVYNIIVILIIIIAGSLIYIFRGNLSFNIGQSVSTKNAFADYKVDTNFKNGMFRVELRDLVTSTGAEEKHYFRYDITVDAEDKPSAKLMKDKSDQVAYILNSVMMTFRPDQLDTDAERMRVKKLMADKITEYYPQIKIKDLYFTNYVYN